MPNITKEQRNAQFRNFALWQRGGKVCIKDELIGPLTAWLTVLGRRYSRAADAMEAKMVTSTVPGMLESSKRMRWAAEHMAWLAAEAGQNFDREEWLEAVATVSELLGIELKAVEPFDLGLDEATAAIGVPTNATDASAGAGSVLNSVAPRPRSKPTGRKLVNGGRSRAKGKGS